MDKPLEIVFRNMDRSESVAAAIREKCSALERFYRHIIGMHVIVNASGKRHRKGKGYHVTVEVHAPRKRIVASRVPEQKARYRPLNLAINDAFKVITRQLEDYARQQRGDTKHHETRETAPEVAQPPASGVAPIDLTEQMCKWPIGDPHEENFVFCGRATRSGSPYCAEHREVAYQARSRIRPEGEYVATKQRRTIKRTHGLKKAG